MTTGKAFADVVFCPRPDTDPGLGPAPASSSRRRRRPSPSRDCRRAGTLTPPFLSRLSARLLCLAACRSRLRTYSSTFAGVMSMARWDFDARHRLQSSRFLKLRESHRPHSQSPGVGFCAHAPAPRGASLKNSCFSATPNPPRTRRTPSPRSARPPRTRVPPMRARRPRARGRSGPRGCTDIRACDTPP